MRFTHNHPHCAGLHERGRHEAHRGRGHRPPFGEMPWGNQMRGGGPRARRGDVRLAILALLNEGAATNGYALIGQIAERTQGRWRPSPGSIYPVLGQLAEEGLIAGEGGENGGFTITEAGKAHVEAHAEEIGRVWENGRPESAEQQALIESLQKLMGATRELAVSGTDEQRTEATALLDEWRRKLYSILAG